MGACVCVLPDKHTDCEADATRKWTRGNAVSACPPFFLFFNVRTHAYRYVCMLYYMHWPFQRMRSPYNRKEREHVHEAINSCEQANTYPWAKHTANNRSYMGWSITNIVRETANCCEDGLRTSCWLIPHETAHEVSMYVCMYVCVCIRKAADAVKWLLFYSIYSPHWYSHFNAFARAVWSRSNKFLTL